MKYKRIFLIILDSLGIGASKDADKYGDGMANSVINSLEKCNVDLPNFRSLGLFKLIKDEEEYKTVGYYTKALPNTKIKCSVLNHLEMLGSKMKKEYLKFDLSKLDKDLINYIEAEIDRKIIISDTYDTNEIMKKYGIEQIKTGSIVIAYDYYNLKIMSHESIIPIKELNKLGNSIIDILYDKGFFINKIVIKTFSGSNDFILNKDKIIITFQDRTETILEKLKNNGYKIITIGKSTKIFNNNEVTNICKTTNDLESARKLLSATTFNFNGVCICNFSDLNICGHRRDYDSYSKVLKNYDNLIPLILKKMTKDDLVIFTSDQGNDPTYSGNDHTRENIPVLMVSMNFKKSDELPYFQSLSDIAALIADNFGIDNKYGNSMLERLK